MALRLTVIDWRTACRYVDTWHRHLRRPVGYLFAVGAANDADQLVGVAIAGRPVARHLDDGATVELTRCATDGTRNACSMLDAAVARAAFALGYRRVVTYTRADESGASLRAAGYRVVAQRPPRAGWDTPARPREPGAADHIPRTLWEHAG